MLQGEGCFKGLEGKLTTVGLAFGKIVISDQSHYYTEWPQMTLHITSSKAPQVILLNNPWKSKAQKILGDDIGSISKAVILAVYVWNCAVGSICLRQSY